MNLKDKLSRLDKSGETADHFDKHTESHYWREDFERELNAKIISEKSSFIFLKEDIYPVYSFTHFQNLNRIGFIIENFHHITGELDTSNFNLRKTVFIDLETTGLSGGTGTYAFLIGIGHIELDHVVVRQYVLPDFQHEWLLLKHIENSLLSFDNIISFNGKSFDIPLLRNRFTLNRIDTLIDEKLHVDLLHPARRLWKRRLSACDLQNIEYAILGMERINDIPGELIPRIYFDYLRKRHVTPLREVLEHNYHDIVNLILLSIKIGHILTDPINELEHPEDIFSLANYYFRNKRFTLTLPLLQYLLKIDIDSVISREALYLLSMTHKKLGNFGEASALMHRLLAKEKDHPFAIEELAKIYEHRDKDYLAALELIEEGITLIETMEQLDTASPLLEIKPSLLHRRQRLKRKLNNENIVQK